MYFGSNIGNINLILYLIPSLIHRPLTVLFTYLFSVVHQNALWVPLSSNKHLES